MTMKLFSVSFFLLSAISSSILFSQPILTSPVVEKVADGFTFTEGPVWVDGLGLLFSDIPEDKIYCYSLDNVVKLYLKPSGNSNGLALDKDGNLIIAQHGKRQLALLEKDTMVERSLVSLYNSKKLNSPNDIAIKSDGTIFFTDPPYGIKPEEEELGFYGIYSLNQHGQLTLLDSSVFRPNGIVFSLNEQKLYVSDSKENKIYVWDVVSSSKINHKREFVYLEGEGNADGMKIDKNGYLYFTGPGGIWNYSAKGKLIQIIKIPGPVTNCAWGGENMDILYVTSGNTLYLIKNK